MSERREGAYYDKDLFPSCGDDSRRESTVFAQDFLIAERFGLTAVKDTFRRAFSEWKDNAKYLVELCVVMNHLCWRAYGKNLHQLSRAYGEFYHRCRNHAFDENTKFTEEERKFFYDVID